MSDELDFKPKTATRDEEGHYIIIKGTIQQEDLAIIYIHAPNLGSHEYIKQFITNTKELFDNNTTLVGDFIAPLIAMRKSSKQKTNKEIVVLNDTLDQRDLMDIFRTLHPKAAEYTFFFPVHMGHSPK